MLSPFLVALKLRKILWVMGNAVAQDPHDINFYVDAAMKEMEQVLDGKTQADQTVTCWTCPNCAASVPDYTTICFCGGNRAREGDTQSTTHKGE